MEGGRLGDGIELIGRLLHGDVFDAKVAALSAAMSAIATLDVDERAMLSDALLYLVENFGIEEHQRHAELADVAADQTDDR
jgi:hypothetical protein